MFRMNSKIIRHHFEGVHGKVAQMRELVEVLDQMFDSFHKVNKISKHMLGQPRQTRNEFERK
jgi:hypothetical protein